MTSLGSAAASTTSAAGMTIWVCYSINPKFLLPCAVSLKSVVKCFEADPRSAAHALRIKIFHNDSLTGDDFAALAACARSDDRDVSIELCSFNYQIPPLKCAAPWWNNIETVATLILPDLLSDMERVIFLDADTLSTGSLIDLWHTDLKGYPCGCVFDDRERGTPNTGVILYDIPEWNRRSLTTLMLDFVASHPTFNVDQEPFVAIEAAEFLPLDAKWNYHGFDTWMFEANGYNLPVDDLRIVHFNGPPRPWFRGCPRLFSDVWRRRLRETPFRDRELPFLQRGQFQSFRVFGPERWLKAAAQTNKLMLVPYRAFKNVRTTWHYARYRLACAFGQG